MKFWIFIFLSLKCTFSLSAQGHDWWAANTGWDGKSNFSKYIRLKPAWMGPNAFFIPTRLNGVVDTQYRLSSEMQVHVMKGETTINPFLTLNIPFGKRVSLEISGAPFEYFESSHQVKTDRKIFHENYDDHFAAGDVRFLFTGKIKSNPDMAIYMGLQTASGTGIGAARNTDSPLYFFSYAIRSGTERLKWYASSGFTAWQTYDDIHRQNDGWIYNLGVEWRPNPKWLIVPEINGMVAYLKDGDRPIMASARINYLMKRWNIGLGIRKGFIDWPFTTVSFLSAYRF
jgi:hypothetical protein